MLKVIDDQWKDHLLSMDHLKEGIGLRGYGQKDPLVEYKKESFTLFQDMMDRIEDETIRSAVLPAGDHRATASGGYTLDGNDDGGNERRGPFCRSRPMAKRKRKKRKLSRWQPEWLPTNAKRAQSAVQDVTRNIQRKKEKEMAALQFGGGEASSAPNKPVIKAKKARPQ